MNSRAGSSINRVELFTQRCGDHEFVEWCAGQLLLVHRPPSPRRFAELHDLTTCRFTVTCSSTTRTLELNIERLEHRSSLSGVFILILHSHRLRCFYNESTVQPAAFHFTKQPDSLRILTTNDKLRIRRTSFLGLHINTYLGVGDSNTHRQHVSPSPSHSHSLCLGCSHPHHRPS